MVAVLLIAGLHAPVIPFREVVGRSLITAPAQNGPTGSNSGVMVSSIEMVSVTDSAH